MVVKISEGSWKQDSYKVTITANYADYRRLNRTINTTASTM